MYLQVARYEMTQSSYKRDTKSESHPGMKLALVRVFSCKHPLTVSRFERCDRLVPQVAQAGNMTIGDRASALWRNIRNITICMGKKPIVSVTYENERISIKNSLPYTKCFLRFFCVVHGQIYGRFMGCSVNGLLSLYRSP